MFVGRTPRQTHSAGVKSFAHNPRSLMDVIPLDRLGVWLDETFHSYRVSLKQRHLLQTFHSYGVTAQTIHNVSKAFGHRLLSKRPCLPAPPANFLAPAEVSSFNAASP